MLNLTSVQAATMKRSATNLTCPRMSPFPIPSTCPFLIMFTASNGTTPEQSAVRPPSFARDRRRHGVRGGTPRRRARAPCPQGSRAPEFLARYVRAGTAQAGTLPAYRSSFRAVSGDFRRAAAMKIACPTFDAKGATPAFLHPPKLRIPLASTARR